MRLGYHRRRLADLGGAMKEMKAGLERATWSRGRLREFQQGRLDAVVRHAVANSPFHRERLADLVGDGPVDLTGLPVMEKAEMMDRYDDVVADRSLRRDELLDWVEGMERDELYRGGYRVMTTSGSSGRKGLFVYDQRGWQTIVAFCLRQSHTLGMKPSIPRRRFVMVGGAATTHMSRQASASMGVGVHRTMSVPITMPLERMVARLNDFQPDFMNFYPSIACRLAEEQEAGRLRLELEGMSTSSELLTPDVARRVERAFGVPLYDLYATTEGLFGLQCHHRDGYHLFEDATLVENVDADNQPVPPGEPGAKLLVTNLVNHVQPIIRFELPDVVRIDPEPCPCGSPLVRMRSIEGRTDDVIKLPGRDGAEVDVLPIEFGLISRERDVAEFQVVQEGPVLRIRLVPAEGAAPDLGERVTTALGARLAELGAAPTDVRVERGDHLPRTAGGKLQIVVANGHPAQRDSAHVRADTGGGT